MRNGRCLPFPGKAESTDSAFLVPGRNSPYIRTVTKNALFARFRAQNYGPHIRTEKRHE
jgi:hypothetical protein